MRVAVLGRTYDLNALLLQRPRCWVAWSGKPAAEAVVAAPIRRLWLEYCEGSSPAARSAALRVDVTRLYDKNEPSGNVKRGAVSGASRDRRKADMAETGQVDSPVVPTKIGAGRVNWYVLDCTSWTARESTLSVICDAVSVAEEARETAGAEYSLTRKKA